MGKEEWAREINERGRWIDTASVGEAAAAGTVKEGAESGAMRWASAPIMPLAAKAW